MNYYMKFRLDFWDVPEHLDLIEEDSRHLERWLKLVRLFVRSDADGSLLNDQGNPWKLSHIARALGDNNVDALQFLTSCLELGLITTDDNDDQPDPDELPERLTHGTVILTLANHSQWYGEHKTSTERVRKHREKQQAEREKNTARMRAYREQKRNVSGNVSRNVTPSSCSKPVADPVADCSKNCSTLQARDNDVTQVATGDEETPEKPHSDAIHGTERNETFHETERNVLNIKQSKSKANITKHKSKQSKGESATPAVTQTKFAACLFGEKNFDSAADQAHQYLSNSPLPSASLNNTRQKAKALADSSEFGWAAASGAFILAAQRTRHEIDSGKAIGNRWGYLLAIVPDHLRAAEQYTKLAEMRGQPPEYSWSPEPVFVQNEAAL